MPLFFEELLIAISSQNTVFLARGYPGSGRSKALASIASQHPSLVLVSSDPDAIGADFENDEEQFASLKRARAEIAGLVKAGVGLIAVETCAPRNEDIQSLLSAALDAGYEVTVVKPASDDPSDILYCYEHSTHEPSTFFYETLAQEWEAYEATSRHAATTVTAGSRLKVWNEYLAILRLGGDVQGQVNALVSAYPADALALGLMDGVAEPKPARNIPADFPLAGVSSYWAKIRSRAAGSQSAYDSVPAAAEAGDLSTLDLLSYEEAHR